MDSVVSPLLIGRDAEMHALDDALDAARAGRPRAVVIRGEAGIGKTRLLQDFLDHASRSHPAPVVATGQCIDLGSIGAPFTPIRRLLRQLYAAVGDEAFRTAARSPVVLSTLTRLLPDLNSGAAPDTPELDGHHDAVAEAIERLVEDLSRDRLLVLAIEDLHWADSATLDLLATLAVTLRGSHVALVMTYRTDDVGRGHPLRPVLAELERNRSTTTVNLTRLTAEDVRAQVFHIAGALAPQLLDAIIARSDGIPFFVEELVAIGGAELPRTLSDLVLARVERLSTTSRAVAAAVAGGGVHVPHELLVDVFPGDSVSLRDGLREAVAHGVLVADGNGYRFRHALIQEAVYGELLPSERADLHRRYAAAAQTRLDDGADEFAAHAAEHWLRAKDIPRAFDAMVRAREHAVSAHAPTAATRIGEELIELWPNVPDAAGRARVELADLVLEVARGWRATDPDRARRVAAMGLAASDEPVLRALLHAEIAIAHSGLGDHSAAHREIEHALRGLDADSDASRAALARLHSILSTLPASVVGHDVDRLRIASDAARAAEAAGDDDALSTVLCNTSWHLIDRGDLDAALKSVRRVFDLDVTPEVRLNAVITELDILVRQGEFAEAVSVGDVGIALADRVGLERGVGALIAANLTEAHVGVGEPDAAFALFDRYIDLLRSSPLFRSYIYRTIAGLLSWQGRFDAVERILAEQAALIADSIREDTEEQVGWAEQRSEHLLNAAETEADRAKHCRLIADAVAQASLLGDRAHLDNPGGSRRLAPGAARAFAEARLAGVDAEATRRLGEIVLESAASQPDDAPGRAVRGLIHAEVARAEGDDLPDRWRTWLSSSDAARLPVRYTHYVRHRLIVALERRGDRVQADAERAVLASAAASQGAGGIGQWADRGGRRAGRGASPSSSVPELTAREAEVLALIAEGLTNPQIGERLFISPKTASAHVSAILAKIGASNRAEAAAIFTSRA